MADEDVKLEVEENPKKEAEEPSGKKKLRIAIAGCAHGEMDTIYATVAELEKSTGDKFDLLICCGDYQAVRNYGDMHHMHIKEKYRQIQTFYKYYSGQKEAPLLTLFIGGNHEASGYMTELPNGGWVAPKIYYMGFLGVVRFAGLRIAGLSGIYSGKDFDKGHFECPPFSEYGSVVSAYHVRSLEMFRARQLSGGPPVDIFLSHDWPGGITEYGDEQLLLRIKPFLRDDILSGKLGNPGARDLLKELRPRYWFAAHMHVQFAAMVRHAKAEGESEEAPPTRFLSLDKPIPHRRFLQGVELEVDSNSTMELEYDEYWLAILRNTDHLTNVTSSRTYLPSKTSLDERWDFRPTEKELADVRELGSLRIPLNFRLTAPPLLIDDQQAKSAGPTPYYRNPQTAEFCEWLGIKDLNKILCEKNPEQLGMPHYLCAGDSKDTSVEQDREEFGDEDFIVDSATSTSNFLETFEAPKFVSKSNESGDGSDQAVEFKRRKVDIPDE